MTIYRPWWRFLGVAFEAESEAYFTAASITDTTEKRAANTFIKTLKDNGLWTKLDRIYLRSPTSLAACLMCCKSLTSQVAINSPTFASNGLTFNGTTNYARSDVAVSALANITTTSGSIMYMCEFADMGNVGLSGSAQTGSQNFYLYGDGVA